MPTCGLGRRTGTSSSSEDDAKDIWYSNELESLLSSSLDDEEEDDGVGVRLRLVFLLFFFERLLFLERLLLFLDFFRRVSLSSSSELELDVCFILFLPLEGPGLTSGLDTLCIRVVRATDLDLDLLKTG